MTDHAALLSRLREQLARRKRERLSQPHLLPSDFTEADVSAAVDLLSRLLEPGESDAEKAHAIVCTWWPESTGIECMGDLEDVLEANIAAALAFERLRQPGATTEERRREWAAWYFSSMPECIPACENAIAACLSEAIAAERATHAAEVAGRQHDYEQMESAWRDRKEDCDASLAAVKEKDAEIERAKTEEKLLVDLWRSPAFADYGEIGDDACLSPAGTAVLALKELREAVKKLAHQLDRRADGMDPLTKQLREEKYAALAERDSLKAEVERLKAETAAERKEWALQVERARAAEAERATRAAEVERMRMRAEAAEATNQGYHDAQAELEAAVKEKDAEITGWMQSHDDVCHKAEELRESLTTRLDAAEATITTRDARIVKTISIAAKLRLQRDAAEAERDDARGERDAYMKSYADVCEDRKQVTAERDAALAMLREVQHQRRGPGYPAQCIECGHYQGDSCKDNCRLAAVLRGQSQDKREEPVTVKLQDLIATAYEIKYGEPPHPPGGEEASELAPAEPPVRQGQEAVKATPSPLPETPKDTYWADITREANERNAARNAVKDEPPHPAVALLRELHAACGATLRASFPTLEAKIAACLAEHKETGK